MVGRGRRKDSGAGQVPWLARVQSGSAEQNQGSASSELPWKPRTRQEKGRQTEKQIAKNRGAKVHPASGALRIKHDASDADTLYEIKDANKTYTIKGSELLALYKRANMELKEPLFVVYFTDADITVTMNITKGKQ